MVTLIGFVRNIRGARLGLHHSGRPTNLPPTEQTLVVSMCLVFQLIGNARNLCLAAAHFTPIPLGGGGGIYDLSFSC